MGGPTQTHSISQHEHASEPIGPGGWIFIASEIVVGGCAVGFAASPEFAADRVTFASDVWRFALAALGAGLLILAARGITRMVGGAKALYDPRTIARRRKIGAVFASAGLGLILINAVPPLAERTITFSSWAKGIFLAAGIQFLLLGLAAQLNPAKGLQRQRLRKGQGRHGTATIIRAEDTGMLINSRPQVKIELMIEVAGSAPYRAEDKIVMQQAKLALLIPGSTLDVTVDQSDNALFHIDWGSWRGPS